VKAHAAVLVLLLLAGCTPKPVFRGDPSQPRPDGDGSSMVGLAPGQPVTKTRVEEVASVWLGTPYRYGGTDERGLDCSALVQIVVGDLGVDVPRTTRDQLGAGRQIDPRDLQAGDLVFFRLESSQVNHVGLALGRDRFIHAATSRGVVVDRLMSDYFSQRFVEARRVFPE